jgi:phosphoribosylformylglycinamidine synthase
MMMPHIERSTFNGTGHYQRMRNDEVSPWHEAFVNAKKWIDKKYFDLYIKAFSKGALFF